MLINGRSVNVLWELPSVKLSLSQSILWSWSCTFISYIWSHWDDGNEYLHLLNWRKSYMIKMQVMTSRLMVISSNHYSELILCMLCGWMKKEENGFIRVSNSLVGVLGVRLPRTDKVALSLDDAPALDNNGVAQDPLQPPVSDVQLLRSLLHRLLECSCWHQLCGWKHEAQRGAV